MQVAYARGMGTNRPHRENRKRWLRRWMDEAGGPKALAAKVDTHDTYLIAIAKEGGDRNVGDEMARRIERALKKPPNMMDLPFDDSDAPSISVERAVAVLADALLVLSKEQRAAAAIELAALAKSPDSAGTRAELLAVLLSQVAAPVPERTH